MVACTPDAGKLSRAPLSQDLQARLSFELSVSHAKLSAVSEVVRRPLGSHYSEANSIYVRLRIAVLQPYQ